MRSNGAVHINNDTFMSCPQGDTAGVYLVTSKIVEERVCFMPLERRVRFGGHVNNGENHQDIGQHSLHASPDGSFVASISADSSKHYYIDVLKGGVCEFHTDGPVMGIAWHPVSKSVLFLLLCAGRLLVVSTDRAVRGLGFLRRESVCLHRVVATCGEEHLGAQLLSEGSGDLKECVLKICDANCGAGGDRKSLSSAESAWSASDQVSEAALEDLDASAVETPTSGRDASEGGPSVLMSAVESDAETMRCRGRDEFVGMCIIPPTASLPVMLVLLGENGDIFSVKLDERGIPASLSKEYDGTVEAALCSGSHSPAGVVSQPCVHHLVRGDKASCSDTGVPLAVGTTLLDEDVGLHVVFIMYSNGTLRGYFFDEPDILCHNLKRQREDVSVVLGAAVPQDHVLLRNTASRGRLVGLQSCGNATLIRYGDEAYLSVWPVWSPRAAGWVYRTETTDGFSRLPVIDRDAKVPQAAVFRLPYDTCGKSVAIGVNDILIFPESRETDMKGNPKEKVMTLKISNLVLIALYARCEAFVLASDPVGNSKGGEGATHSDESGSSTEGGAYPALEELLGLIPTLCQRWLCEHPRESLHEVANSVAQQIQKLQVQFRTRGTRQLEREERLRMRIETLQQMQAELSRDVEEATRTVRDAVVHRRGVSELYAANERMGKIHEVLRTLASEVEGRRKQSDARSKPNCERPPMMLIHEKGVREVQRGSPSAAAGVGS